MFSSLTVKLFLFINLLMGLIYLVSHYTNDIIIGAAISVVTAILISSMFINRYVTAPLDKVIKSMRLLEQGNSNAKLQINSSRQMQTLSESFNLMVVRVIGLVDSTARQVFELAQVQERLQHNAELQAINKELEKSLADVRLLNTRQESIYLNVLDALVSTIEASDPYTHGHSGRVTNYSLALAARIGLSTERINLLKQAAILHDIGKIGIDKSILHNPGRLNDEELEAMRQHPVIATNILRHIDQLTGVQNYVVKHHERFDGKGYPYGLCGDSLPIEARIMAIADTFDAMTSHRPYRKGLPVEVAIKELSDNAGSQFDPVLVEHFIAMFRNGELTDINGDYLIQRNR